MSNFSYIFITGASSGLGKAMALSFAKKGVLLFLSARNKERLNNVALMCENKGAQVRQFIFDIRDALQTKQVIDKISEQHKLDLAIVNAGVSINSLITQEDEDPVRTLFNTNINGVINTTLPIIDIFKKQGFGHLCLISSIAGFRGLPNCPAYSASKNFVKSWGEALFGALKKKNICVTTVCPGFITTPLTDKNKFYMPFKMSAEKAAEIIKKGLEKKKCFITFPYRLSVLVWFASILPSRVLLPILAMLPTKEDESFEIPFLDKKE